MLTHFDVISKAFRRINQKDNNIVSNAHTLPAKNNTRDIQNMIKGSTLLCLGTGRSHNAETHSKIKINTSIAG